MKNIMKALFMAIATGSFIIGLFLLGANDLTAFGFKVVAYCLLICITAIGINFGILGDH